MPTETDNPDYTNIEKMMEEDEVETETGEEEQPDEEPEQGVDDDAELPEKFRGKSKADIYKSYRELEQSQHQRVQQEALRMAQEMIQGGKIDPKVAKDVAEEDDDLDLTDEQISKMSPREFIKLVNKQATERAQKMVSRTIQQQNEMMDNVKAEIREVTKEYPQIKDNKNFREVVIDIVDAASARGKKMTLMEATKLAADRMGIKPGEAAATEESEKPAKKKPRTEVEKPRGTDGGNNKTEEDMVKEGILNAGKQSTGLGGLGI